MLRPLLLRVRGVVADDDEERGSLLSCNPGADLYPSRCMAHKHEEAVPIALESVVSRLGELEVVLGAQAGPTVAAVRAVLTTAMAARDRGDMPAAIAQIGQAMDQLAGLADGLDAAEAALMRALAQTFRAALLTGDTARARESTAAMFEKSGATERKKP